MQAAANQLHPHIKGAAVHIAARLCGHERQLEVAYVGDSQLLLLRGGDVIHRTQPQYYAQLSEHQQVPLQVGTRPNGAQVTNTPTTEKLSVMPGDIYVMGEVAPTLCLDQ